MEIKDLKLTKKRLEICEKLGFLNSDDILHYYPFKYENIVITAYKDFKIGGQVVFEGELISYPSSFRKGRITISRFKVLYEDNELNITIFNRPWINTLKLNEKLVVVGKYEGNNKVLANNYYSKDIKEVSGIIPTYSLKEGISQNEIKKLIKFVFDKCYESLKDELPSDLIKEHHLISYKEAIKNIHYPKTDMDIKLALSRLKYEEFLRFYVALDILKGNSSVQVRGPKEFPIDKVNDLIESFEFKLTSDQEKCVDDILNDLRSKKVMYRLLQGEVGSGKTAIALIGLYANYLSGYQGALMAPTEILAKQHYESISKSLYKYGVKVGLLYSGIDNSIEIKKKIENGDFDIIIGTHALFSEDVKYKNLGLVIADEQHRFGVKQRRALKDKGENCDFILMSATPIPRTLASSLYGDMDISTIETLPIGRKGCKTYLVKENSIRSILDDLLNILNNGEQIYIICAAIEASENYNAKDVVGLYNALRDKLKPYHVSLLHGKLDSAEKDQIMNDFKDNKIQVLISTTVVEVGLNVKNATCMVIYDADKFGLAQLHQLRGRVQRGNKEGKCYLLSDSCDDNVLKRLNILVETNDGFKISYEDLRLRGPGDILGTRQSGLPAFILGNLVEDSRFIEAARRDVKMIKENLDKEEYAEFYSLIAQMAIKNYRD